MPPLWKIVYIMLDLKKLISKVQLVRWLLCSFLYTALFEGDKTTNWWDRIVYYGRCVVATWKLYHLMCEEEKKKKGWQRKRLLWHSLSVMEAIVFTVKSTSLCPLTLKIFDCFPRMLSQVCKPSIWDGRKDKLVRRLVDQALGLLQCTAAFK